MTLVENINWARTIGDTVFALGAIALVVYVFGLAMGYSLFKE